MIWAGLIILVAVIAFAVRRSKAPAEQLQVLIRKRNLDLERNPKPDPPHDDSGFY